MKPHPKAVTDWHKSVCRPGASVATPEYFRYVSILQYEELSPIDIFFKETERLNQRGSPDFFANCPELSIFLVAALASHTENYFRSMFSGLLLICPLSQVKASARDMKLGSAIWHRIGSLERGAFEHFSFASADNIIDTINRYFDIKIDEKSDPYPLLQNFDVLCELRHAIVHSGGLVSGKNALKLQILKNKSSMKVDINFERFQEASLMCTALVCSINTDLFRRFAERWRDKWPGAINGWNDALRREKFNQLWRHFRSARDDAAGLLVKPLSAAQCRREILSP
ncbi:hypothetical protein LJR118_001608 [Acidovorax sp. LjRoot118]|uniref:hypothetical protein n=1 Tax=Acidovorax sp. LjRoot118 TaxID=3342256 RepID=UPI003ED14E9D